MNRFILIMASVVACSVGNAQSTQYQDGYSRGYSMGENPGSGDMATTMPVIAPPSTSTSYASGVVEGYKASQGIQPPHPVGLSSNGAMVSVMPQYTPMAPSNFVRDPNAFINGFSNGVNLGGSIAKLVHAFTSSNNRNQLNAAQTQNEAIYIQNQQNEIEALRQQRNLIQQETDVTNLEILRLQEKSRIQNQVNTAGGESPEMKELSDMFKEIYEDEKSYPGEGRMEFLEGCAYALGLYGNKDYQMAISRWEASAKCNYTPSMIALGLAYTSGKIAPMDTGAAKNWFKMAAKNGSSFSDYCMGVILYSESLDEIGKLKQPESLVEAYAWINLGSIYGYDDPSKIRNQLESSMSHAAIFAAQRRSAEIEQELHSEVSMIAK